MSHEKRLPELSWLNVAFCAMVLWSHSSSYALTHLSTTSWQYALMFSLQRICYVSVYGFFFLSGLKLTLSRREPPPLLSFWARRGKAILWPYVLSVAVYYLWFSVILGYFSPSLPDFLGYVVRGDLCTPFYFTIALAQFILLAPLLRRLARDCSPVLLIPAALIITQTCTLYYNNILQIFLPGAELHFNDRLFTTYLVYYLAGCCAGNRYDDFLDMVRGNKTLLSVMTASFAALDLVLCWLNYTGRRSVSFTFFPATLFYLSAIPFSFLIALRLPRRMPGWLAAVDRASFLIYLYHSLALSAIDGLLHRLGVTRVGALFVLRASFTFLATPIACIIWQRLWAAVKQQHKPKIKL